MAGKLYVTWYSAVAAFMTRADRTYTASGIEQIILSLTYLRTFWKERVASPKSMYRNGGHALSMPKFSPLQTSRGSGDLEVILSFSASCQGLTRFSDCKCSTNTRACSPNFRVYIILTNPIQDIRHVVRRNQISWCFLVIPLTSLLIAFQRGLSASKVPTHIGRCWSRFFFLNPYLRRLT